MVDDEPDLCEIFGKWFQMLGCGEVRIAANGEAALAAIHAAPIDLLVSDIRMPVMDGVALVRRLNELKIHIPVIVFVSAFGDVDMREMHDLGVEAFLAKPLRRQELVGCLQRAIADRSELWLDRMDPSPKQTMHVDVDRLAKHPEASHPQQNLLALGRGGFSVRAQTPLTLGGVQFACSFPAAGPEDQDRLVLSGEGAVRWYSRADQIAGIEFVYLDPSCREWVLEAIGDSPANSFIPR